MRNLILLAFLSTFTLLASCTTTDLPPHVQSNLEELAGEIAPYVEEYDLNDDNILTDDEIASMDEEDRLRVTELYAEFDSIYQEGIQQNTTMFVSFLRGLGIPAPPGSEIPAAVLASLFFERPRRQATVAVKEAVNGLKNIGNGQGGPSFFESARALLSMTGLIDSTEASKAAAKAHTEGKAVTVVVDEEDQEESEVLEG